MDAYLSAVLQSFGTTWYLWLLTAVIAYIFGSFNPAILITKIWTKGKVDIRSVGSGNAGFTNVLRAVGKIPAIITLVLDALKCVAAVLVGGYLFTFIAVNYGSQGVLPTEITNCGKYLAGIFCILGHSFPIFFHFKGGKGVVSAAALMLTEDWRVFLMILGTFLIIFAISRIISLGSVISAIMYGPYTFLATFLFDYTLSGAGYHLSYVILSTAAALIIGTFVTVKHKDNIKRLIRGEEKKIKAKD